MAVAPPPPATAPSFQVKPSFSTCALSTSTAAFSPPEVHQCTTSTLFQELAETIQTDIRENMPVWRERYPGVEALSVAVMGCIVNGPGESKHADIGISLPGTAEVPSAPVYMDGVKVATLRGANIARDFHEMVLQYIERRYGRPATATAAE